MHPKLVKANIALFQGSRAETLRLLDEYAEESGHPRDNDPNAPLVMWLDAQAQNQREERIERLHALVSKVDADNQYGKLARAYLEEEENYEHKINPQPARRSQIQLIGVPVWKGLVFAIMGGLLTFIGLSALNLTPSTAPGQSVDQTTQTTTTPQPTVPDLPDRSQALVADSYTGRYGQGILQVVAFEDGSERVVDLRSMTLLQPVAGARFYALSLIFECREAICNEPPEADLALRLDNGDSVAARTNVGIAGERLFEPLALGRTTAGWAVFEIPIISAVDALLITPNGAATDTPPVVISLGAS